MTGQSLTAADFTLELHELHGLNGTGLVPHAGWRGRVYRLTGGLLNPGPSAGEQHLRALLGSIVTPVQQPWHILILCRKGGVGKTTITALLGHLLASRRGDRVVALDVNPDAGSLGARVRRQTTATITDLLRDLDAISSYAQLRAYTSQAPSRLEVIASDGDPRITHALTETDYQRAIALLERYFTLIVLDSGTGILDSATQGVLEVADQIVIPLSASLDDAHVASQTLDWLEEHGKQDLVAGAVAVINQIQGGEPVDRVREHFAERCRQVVELPWDPYLDLGADTSVAALQPATQHACLELAAAVAEGFRGQRPRGTP